MKYLRFDGSTTVDGLADEADERIPQIPRPEIVIRVEFGDLFGAGLQSVNGIFDRLFILQTPNHYDNKTVRKHYKIKQKE